MHKSWPMSTDMPTLLELQMQLRRAVLGGDTAEIVAAIHDDGLDPAARVGIYRNHAFAALGASLQGTFPVVCRLGDERRALFLQRAPHLLQINIAATVREVTPLSPVALAAVPAEQAANVALRLQPSLTYLTSPWPIDAIWRANQQSEVSTIDLASGGISLEVRRSGAAVAWRRLDPASFAFRTALADGFVLAAAMAGATLQDPAFDLAAAIQHVFAEGLATAYCLSPEEEAPQ